MLCWWYLVKTLEISVTTTAIKERPILFSGPMVRAILEGRKTQTRRIVKDGPAMDCCIHWSDNEVYRNSRCGEMCPYGLPRERLWVRETWSPSTCAIPLAKVPNVDPRTEYPDIRVWYSCDNDRPTWAETNWHPSIHMPRWASRINLEIVCIRVERLNEISHHDALQEGLIEWSDPPRVTTLHYGLNRADCWETSAPAAYKRLWSTIHAADGPNGWAANPWVWVVEFKVVRNVG